MTQKKSLLRSATIMMIIMLLGKFLGLYRDILNADIFGTNSIEGTAFSYASMIPRNFLDIIFASSITGSFIPVFNHYHEKKGKEEAFKLAHNFISIIILISTFITVLSIIFSPQIIDLMVANTMPTEVNILAISLLRFMFPILIISSLAFTLTGVLQSLDEFSIPAAMSICSNIIIIIYYLFFIDDLGVYGLVLFYLLGWLSQVLIQVPFLIKNKFSFRFSINFKDSGIREIFILMLPVMLSTWVNPINLLVNTSFSSTLGLYGPNAINYANTIYLVVTGIFATSVGNVIFPTLSKLNSNEDTDNFGKIIKDTISLLFFILIPMTFGLFALSTPIIRVLFEHGEFDATSTYYTSIALSSFSIGILGYGFQVVLSRCFYSLKNGKVPAICGLISIGTNFILSGFLVTRIGLYGPALAQSFSILLGSFIMLVVLYKMNNSIFTKETFINMLIIFFISLIMYGVVCFTRDYLLSLDFIFRDIFVISISTFVGLIVFFGLSFLFKVKEARYLINLLGGLKNGKL